MGARRRFATTWTVGVALALGAGVARADDLPVAPAVPASVPPSVPPAPPPPSEAKNLDESMAVVEGTVLTRRRMVRALGPRPETQEEDEYEHRLRRKLVERATELVFLKAAEREGLKIPPEYLDNAVREQGRKEVDAATKKLGRPVTLEEILAEKNLTPAEYRESLGNKIVIHHYFQAMWSGASGKRPQFDLDPSPCEIRRMYEKHAAEFDVKPSVKIAFWMANPMDHLDAAKGSYGNAVAEATRRLDVVLGLVREGKPLKEIATTLSLPDDSWLAPDRAFPRDRFVELFQRVEFARPIEAVADWLFDPQRKVRDGRVFEGSRGMLVAVVPTEIAPGRKRTFADPEVQEEIVKAVREIRRQRAMNQHLLRLLSTASIHPPILAEQIEASVRDDLKKLDTDPFAKSVWLR